MCADGLFIRVEMGKQVVDMGEAEEEEEAVLLFGDLGVAQQDQTEYSPSEQASESRDNS